MKHLISVPFMLSELNDYGAEGFIAKLKEAQADIVFLALDAYETDVKKREKVFADLKKYVPVFANAGFKVGVWVWAFMVRNDKEYTHITSLSGAVSHDQVCPSDENFCRFAEEYVKNIALSKPDMIMFDDDFRYGFLDCGLGCACGNHRKYMSELLGKDVPLQGLAEKAWSGKGNEYRSAWLKANGHFFRRFAERMRRAIDAIDDGIRLGTCTCLSSWDYDGVSPEELAKIMAGKNKPFLRLIGAPYWAVNRNWGNRVQDVIELERMESSWIEDVGGIDVFSECDAYPRPRCACPVSYIEGFDMALRASGAVNGTHKYMLDYVSDPKYDTGYILRHRENKPIYDKIEKRFGGKTPVGVRVYERRDKFADMQVPEKIAGKDDVQNLFFSPPAKLLAAQTIPTVYSGRGVVGIAFGENAEYVPKDALTDGLIIDIPAAKILCESGVDVGLKSVGKEITADREYFTDGNYINLMANSAVDISVKDGAEILSYFYSGDKRIVGSYAYENADGQKFLVYAVDGYFTCEHFFRQKARGKQIADVLQGWGKKLPATLLGNSDCYMLCREDERELAVFLGNFSADELFNKTILLNREYKSAEFINCNGKLKKDRLVIDGLSAFKVAAFVLKK